MKKSAVYTLTVTALMSAVLCLVGPLSIFIGAVPLSVATLAVYAAGILLGAAPGAGSCAVYVMLGLVGLPVFSGYEGGPAKLAGPTGGFLIGYVLAAFVTGWLTQKTDGALWGCITGMLLGTAGMYAVAAAWFTVVMQTDLLQALSVCVVPFLVGDAVKMAAAAALGLPLRRRLRAIGILPGAHSKGGSQ